MSRNKEQTQRGGRRRRRLCVLCFCSFISLYYEYLWIFLIYSLYIPHIYIHIYTYIYIYIYVLNIFHLVSFVCFVVYSVNSRSAHDRSQTFGSIWHVSGPKLSFWCNFIMVLHGFVWRSSRRTVLRRKTTSIKNFKIISTITNICFPMVF